MPVPSHEAHQGRVNAYSKTSISRAFGSSRGGRYWARTSDPQLVDSEQRSRQFTDVRPERIVERNQPSSEHVTERERTPSVAIVATRIQMSGDSTLAHVDGLSADGSPTRPASFAQTLVASYDGRRQPRIGGTHGSCGHDEALVRPDQCRGYRRVWRV